MRTIISVEHVEFWKDKAGKKHTRTHALIKDEIGNIEEAVGYGHDFQVGDQVEYFHHHLQNKMRKKPA